MIDLGVACVGDVITDNAEWEGALPSQMFTIARCSKATREGGTA